MVSESLLFYDKFFENIGVKDSMESFVNCTVFSKVMGSSGWTEISVQERLQIADIPHSWNLNFNLKTMYNHCLVLSRLILSFILSLFSFSLPFFLFSFPSYCPKDQFHTIVYILGLLGLA